MADPTMQIIIEALEIGRDAAQAEASAFHESHRGYKPHRHAALDADVAKIDAALAAARSLQEQPQEALTVPAGLRSVVANHIADLRRCVVVLLDYPDLRPTANEITKAADELCAALAAASPQQPAQQAPQGARMPLTEERIHEVCGTGNRDEMMRRMARNIARAVEAAHGIALPPAAQGEKKQ